MSRRHADLPTMSLFTFLDGLVCTMGALILLLLVMTQRLRSQPRVEETPVLASVEEVVPEPVTLPEPPAVEPVNEEELAERRRRREAWLAQLAEIAAQRDRDRAAVEHEKRKLTDAEKNLLLAQADLSQVQDQLGAVQAEYQQLNASEKQLLQTQTQLSQQVALTKRNVDLLKQKQAAQPSRYALVPYDGASGTTRRPIYVECTDKGIRILPENETLTPEDLDGFTEGYNPLLAAVQALSRYWSVQHRADESEPEPYVLLLVRPSGSVSYYLARRLLTRLSTPFGYELIDEDWPLDVPTPDPKAKLIAHEAIRDTLQARTEVVATLSGAPIRSGDTFSARRPPSRIIPEELPAGNGDGSGTTNGTSKALGRSGPVASEQRGNGTGNSPGKTGPQLARIGLGSGDGTGQSSDGGGSLYEVQRGNGTGNSSGKSGPQLARIGLGSADGTGQSTSGGGSLYEVHPGKLGGTSTTGNEIPSDELVTQTTAGQAPRGPLPESGGKSPSQPLPPETGDWRNRVPATSAALGGREPQDDRQGAGDSTDELEGHSTPRGNPLKQAQAQPGSAPGSSAGASASEPSRPGISFSNGSASGSPAGEGTKKQWGYTRGKASIGLEHKLEIHCYADRLLIGPNDSTVPIGEGEKRDELVQRVINAVERSAQGWGRPPANFYWIPSVKFVVFPGGNQHYERLHAPLRKWGLFSTVEYKLGDTPRQPLPGSAK